MLKILFVLYNTFIANSAIHIHHLANALCERGHECLVAVPDNKEAAQQYLPDKFLYTPLTYAETLTPQSGFSNGREPDIIHAWTPREIVREYCGLLKEHFPHSKLLIHLEDHEEVLFERYLHLPIRKLRSLWGWRHRKQSFPNNLIHPWHYKNFLRTADGITIIIDALRKFVPRKTPFLLLWPIIDVEKFGTHRQSSPLRQELGVRDDEVVIVYTGNAHPTNADDVKSLYVAVGLANQAGIRTRLIRTGMNHCSVLNEQEAWINQYVLELGFLPGERIPELLAIADFLIQPGRLDRFNEYRLPSKIPEFLASARPVVVPQTNIGCILKDHEEAFLLKTGDATEIAAAIKTLKNQNELVQRLSTGARAFASRHFDKTQIVQALEGFYKAILTKKIDKKRL